MTEDWSKECASQKHQWCDGQVHVPPDLIPEGQDGIKCRCWCHKGLSGPPRRPQGH
jgi:hypothetical protein